MDYELFGVRISTGLKVSLKATKKGDLYIAQHLPPSTLMALTGKMYEVMASSAAACLASATIPTTAALGTLWNGEDAGGKVYVIDRVFAQQVASDVATKNRYGLWVCNHIAMTAPTASITAFKNTSGDDGAPANARFGVGETVIDDGWFPVGDSELAEENQTDGGSQKDVPLFGRYVVKPQHGFSIHCVSNDTNITVRVGVSFYILDIDLS